MENINLKAPELTLFDPNNYTEDKNPILSALFHTIINEKLGNNSDEVRKMLDNSIAVEEFESSLTKEQISLYNDVYWENGIINAKIEAERFIFGFKFALMVFNEVFNL